MKNKFISDDTKSEAVEYLAMFVVWLAVVGVLAVVSYGAFSAFGVYFVKSIE